MAYRRRLHTIFLHPVTVNHILAIGMNIETGLRIRLQARGRRRPTWRDNRRVVWFLNIQSTIIDMEENMNRRLGTRQRSIMLR